MEGGRYPISRIGEKTVLVPEMVTILSKKTGVPKYIVHKVIIAHIEEIKNLLMQNRKISMRGFGLFDLSYRKDRLVRARPGSKEMKTLPAHRYPIFVPGLKFRMKIRELPKHFKTAQAQWKENKESSFIEK